jgi:hypothetical protein
MLKTRLFMAKQHCPVRLTSGNRFFFSFFFFTEALTTSKGVLGLIGQ